MLFVHLLCLAATGVIAGPVGVRDEASTRPIPPPIGDDGQPLPPPHHPPHGMLPLPLPGSGLSLSSVASPTSTGSNLITFTPPNPTASVSKPQISDCTTTFNLNLLTNLHLVNVTSTVHPSTVTFTRLFNCHGCPNLVIHNIGGLGPVVQFVSTVTDSVSPTTVTEYVCSRTPASVLETAVSPTTQSPSPPPALPTPRN
ncbi:hypothetical protein SBRCBS47491_003224 [Sporothrix bragantina]|uniref:Uncharacterized protein n=1 Tax=Sporothrix bragantina TaxID=671064 RepID=A0ABP0BDP9_9PEZI